MSLLEKLEYYYSKIKPMLEQGETKMTTLTVNKTPTLEAYYIFNHPFLKVNEERNRHEALYVDIPCKMWSRDKNENVDSFRRTYLHYDEKDYEIYLKDIVSSKETYLAWLREWRDCYNFISKEIRYAKSNRKKDHPDTSREQYQWIGRAQTGRCVAKRMNIMRAVAKRMSWDNKLAQLELREVA